MSTTAEGQPEIVTTIVAGRSRKRLRVRRRNENNTGNNTEKTTKPSFSSSQSTIDDTIEESLTYPKGRPWRVLWPRPHGEPLDLSSSSSKRKKIPRIKDFRRAWKVYKETWEDGLSGIPSEKTNIKNTGGPSMSMSNSLSSLLSSSSSSSLTSPTPTEELQNIGDNAAKNLRSVRQDAQELLEQAKENTGIRNQEDMKELASEMMTIATECIKEFMAGYRKGRDTEIDKMLHEYFQDNDEDEEEKKDNDESDDAINNTNDQITKTRRRKRKPKRGIPRE